MTATASDNEIAAAEAYERLHVPALFGQWAPRVADAADIASGERVLDVACGTGVLARAVAGRVGPTGHVAAVDPGPGMLAVAAGLAPGIEWHAGTAEHLPFADASFDAVVSQFGLMFFADGAAGIGEMIRVTRPGGRVTVAVWDAVERVEAYAIVIDLLERIAGADAAAALRAPFALGETAALKALLRQAGARHAEVTTFDGAARFPGIRVMVEAELRGWLPIMGIELTEQCIDAILREAEGALARYVTANGTVEFATPAHIAIIRKV